MNTKILFSAALMLLISLSSYSQYRDDAESIGLPGDNLNLYATLKLFQESPTLESFEKELNNENNNINNLDLNGDNQIDYIRVIDNIDKNVHVITLQVAINQREIQDLAIIVVQNDNNKVKIQVIGDEALYGKDYIIEPNFTDENDRLSGSTPNPGYIGNKSPKRETTIVINHYTTNDLYNWPIITYIYTPSYKPWYSPWYWGYYPSYWHSWNPYPWHYYWGYNYHWHDYYHSHYRHWNKPRYSRLNEYYGPRRSTSVIVKTKIEKSEYRSTYSKPEMAEKGSETFRKKYPESVYSNKRIPDIKNNGNNIQNNYINRPNQKVGENNKDSYYSKPENNRNNNFNNKLNNNSEKDLKNNTYRNDSKQNQNNYNQRSSDYNKSEKSPVKTNNNNSIEIRQKQSAPAFIKEQKKEEKKETPKSDRRN